MIALLSAGTSAQRPQRTIAITIDDLPVVSTQSDIAARRRITKKLLGHLTRAKVPAIGFVNENKLYSGNARDERQVDLLRMWLAAGFELGNHTFSHRSLNTTDLEVYKADVLKGQTITKELVTVEDRALRFFRHPFLQTGRSVEVKRALESFLTEHGYRIAPISFDNADYIFSRAYDLMRDAGNKRSMKEIGRAYVPYMEAKLSYWERQSVTLFGREISQTLLIHANSINAEYLDDLIAMFRRRGYRIVDLDTALSDEAYLLPDNYIGPAGISWLHRWARDKGRDHIVADEPTVPAFVLKLSGFGSE